MRSRLLFLVGACGLLGCVSFPHARLLTGSIKAPWGDDVGKMMAREVVAGPVVCGPVGFRKVPLQARWGEYVRVTVSAPGALRGSVLVHAGGVAQEPRSWNTESDGALVVDARFPNEDVDRRFALERERPIDLTLTGLEGACEGAVFTVEHGALVPSIDERAWIAELERRGGPELAARREAARLEADARRQAHYAQWEARQVEVSAEALAQASLLREAHYATWEARHAVAEVEAVALGAEVAGDGAGGACVSGECAGNSGPGSSSAGVAVNSGSSFGGGRTASGLSADSTPCAAGACVGPHLGGVAGGNSALASGAVAVSGDATPCASGTCGGASARVWGAGVGACTSGACGASFGGVAGISGDSAPRAPSAGPGFGASAGSGEVSAGPGFGGASQGSSEVSAALLAPSSGASFGGALAVSGGVSGEPSCTSGASVGGGSASSGVRGCAPGACGDSSPGGVASGGVAAIGSSSTLLVPGPSSDDAVEVSGGLSLSTPTCASGLCGGSSCASGSCALSGVGGLPSAPCTSGACGGAHLGVKTGTAPCASGPCSVDGVTPMPLADAASVSIVSSPAEWIRPPDASLRVAVDDTWVQPPEAQLRATATIESSWEQPFVEPRLEPVAITTESHVVSTQQPQSLACTGTCAQPVDPAVSVVVPALFHLLFNVAVSASQPPPAHGAQAIPPRR